MNTYNWNAKDYERNSLAQQKWARELIEKLDLTGSEDVLDLGCGDGNVTAEIAELLSNGSVVGVDNSESMIDLATKNHLSNLYQNLSFKVMDASSISFDRRFDVVFSNAALHWIKNHKPVVEGWIRTTWLPYIERVPEENRDKFINTISSKYVEREPEDSDGKVHVSMVRLEVEAEKIT